LCDYLWENGVAVHFAYSDRRGSDPLWDLVARVEAHGGRTLNLKTANRPEPADAAAFRALWHLARDVRPDVVHSHSAKAGFLGRALRACGIRAVQCYHPHAYVGMRPHHGRFDRIYDLIEAALGRLAETIVVSAGEASFARGRLKIPESHLHLIPNGVDVDVFSPATPEEKRRLREKFGLPPETLLLGNIGRSSEQKDPLTLYRAFAQAAAKRPIALLHVGKGELDEELVRLVRELKIEDRVFRFPYTSNPAEFYRAIDGFILTSRYEGFSLAVLEALAVNLPVIHSIAPGNCDLLQHPLSHRWSAPPGDIAGFADAIVAWHDRVHHADVNALNHRQIARACFDVRKSYGEVLELYRSLRGGEQAQPFRRPLRTDSPPP